MQKAKLEKEGIIPRKPFRIPETLTSDEQKRLLKQPNRRYPTRERNLAMLHLMLSMGLRLSEAVNLRWQDVDLLTGKLKVVQANSRLVSLNRCPSILSLRSERKGVRPSFLGFQRLIKALCDHTDAGAQQLYEAPYPFERTNDSLPHHMVSSDLLSRLSSSVSFRAERKSSPVAASIRSMLTRKPESRSTVEPP